MSCAGLGVIAGGGALINTLRATRQQRARAWFGREAGRARRKAHRALGSRADFAPNAGLITAGALLGAGLALFFSSRRSAGETDPSTSAERTAPLTSPIVPDFH